VKTERRTRDEIPGEGYRRLLDRQQNVCDDWRWQTALTGRHRPQTLPPLVATMVACGGHVSEAGDQAAKRNERSGYSQHTANIHKHSER